MSKGQHGNKEAKKPKKVPSPAAPASPAAASPVAVAVAPMRGKKR